MKKEKYNNLRTVALRILPALVLVVAITVSLAAPAQAAGLDYSDYIFSENDSDELYFTSSHMPVTNSAWYLLGYPSKDLLAEGVNGDFFTVDHSQIFLDHGYTIVCDPFGSNGIDVTNIRTGSTMDFSFTINTSVTDDAYEFMKFTLVLSYWTVDNQYISEETYEYHEHSHFGIFDVYDLQIYQPSGADHMRISLLFEEYDLISYQSGDRVGFAIDRFNLTIRQPKSIFMVTLYDYSGENRIDIFRDIEFPCTIRVNENGFTIYNSGSSSADYTYTYSGDSKFLGISQVAYNRDVYWPPGSEFQLTQPDKLYLRQESDETGYIEILNYTGSYTMDRIYQVKFPCTVRVATDGLYFTYAGSGDVNYFFPYGLISNVVGVSLIACDKEIQYPLGSVFTLSWDSYIHLIRDGDIPVFDDPVGDDGSGSDDFDSIVDDIISNNSSSEVTGFWQQMMANLNLSYSGILSLFWHSAWLEQFILMSSLFAVFSYLLFGKKG